MCVIVVKSKGVQFPDMTDIENCCDRNPDGFAMAWNEGGRLRTFKTMDKRLYLKRYGELAGKLDPAATGLVMHMRIATHGSVGVKNCHCWRGSGYAFAHNGVLRIKNRDDMTDSETFLRDYFEPIYTRFGWDMARKVIDMAIESNGSKFAFVDKDGNMELFGRYVKHRECLYSNESWKGIVKPAKKRDDDYAWWLFKKYM